MTKNPTGAKVERVAHLEWIPLSKTKINPLAQRDLNQSRVDKLVADFDPEQLGAPVVNHRGEFYYILDGHHRIEALKVWLGEGWEDQHVQCFVYEGLSEAQEAEVFLKLNDTLAVHAYSKFKVAVHAGRPEAVEIDRTVRSLGLKVSFDGKEGAIAAVGTLVRVYRRSGALSLGRTLGVIRDAYGDPGLQAAVIDGVNLMTHRYNGDVDDTWLVERLSKAHGGVNALLGKAENLRMQTGNPRNHCVAAAAVDIYNAGRGESGKPRPKKLPSWWRADEDS